MNEETLFHMACAKPPDERAAFLDEACAGDTSLRQRLEILLAAHEQPASFLQSAARENGNGEPAADVGRTVFQPRVQEGPGTIIGPYKLLQQIGEGGMGVVFMAEQFQPVRRTVALKIIKPGMDSRQVIARFEAERQALAMMDHPSIARVLDAGTTHSSRPYFVMELVKGLPITKYCDEHRLTPQDRLELFMHVCHAVQHAHQKGIIHRDLKPSNVLIAQYDGKPVPKVIDFGVAKATGQQLTERTMFTGFGDVIGTPEYMSPEQAELNQLDVDTRSDVYSLGVLLYELLTGTTPIEHKRVKEAALLEVLRVIREEEPPTPSTRLSTIAELPSIAAQRGLEPKKLSGLLKGELDWIVMKALEKDRTRRYETADGLALDVQRYLQDEAVQACPPSATYRFRKFAQRNKRALATGIALAAALAVSIVILAASNVLIGRERDQKSQALHDKEAALKSETAALKEARKLHAVAADEATRAKEQESLARQRFYAAQTNLALQAWEAGQPARTLELLESLRPKFDEDDLRGFDWYYLWRLCNKDLRFTIRRSVALGENLAVSPDGKIIAVGGTDGTITLWQSATGLQCGSLRGHRHGWRRLAFSPDGKTLVQAAGPKGRELTLWDIASERQQIVPNTGSCRSLAFSPDGNTLATADDNEVKLWDVATWRQRARFVVESGEVLQLAFSSDSNTLATTSSWPWLGGRVNLWDLTRNPPVVTGNFPWAGGIAFSPDGKSLATSSVSEGRVWDVTTQKEQARYPVSENVANEQVVAFSPDGKFLAYGSQPRSLILWERATAQTRILAHSNDIAALQFLPEGKALVSLTSDGTVKLWDLAAKSKAVSLYQTQLQTAWGQFGTTPMAFSPDGKTLAVSDTSGRIVLWDVNTGEQRATLSGTAGGWGSVSFSRDGKLLATTRGDWEGMAPGGVKIWDVATGRELKTLGRHPSSAFCVAFSPDGKMLASGSVDGTVNLWDSSNFELRNTMKLSTRCKHLAFSPDGKTLAAHDSSNFVRLYDPATASVKGTICEQELVGSLAYSPAGNILALGDENGTVRLWDTATLRVRASLKGHTAAVVSLGFFPDGKTLASGSGDGTVKLWNVATAQERTSLKGGNHLAINGDGQMLAITSEDGTIKLWRAATDREAVSLRTELDPDDPESPVALNNGGDQMWVTGRFEEAEQAYRKARTRLEKLTAAFPDDPDYRQELAYNLRITAVLASSTQPALRAEEPNRRAREICQTLNVDQKHKLGVRYNRFSWRLLMDTDLARHNSECAAKLAEEAVNLAPEDGDFWNTLGVAHYRGGDNKAAVAALKNSIELRQDGDSIDSFFLAMAHWQAGDKEEARRWYDRAVEWTEKNQPKDAAVRRFQTEAEELMKIPGKEPVTNAVSK